MRGKFSFLPVDIWFDLTKCKFTVKHSSFKMLVVFLLIFVADTKKTFVYNFVAPLNVLTHPLILGIIKTNILTALSEYPIKYLELVFVSINFEILQQFIYLLRYLFFT